MIILLLFVSRCTFFDTREQLHEETNGIDLSGEILGRVSLNEDIESEAFQQQHQIKLANPEEKVDSSFYIDNELFVAVDSNNKIIFIRTDSNHSITTQKGVGIGNEIDKVIKIYGENYYKYNDQGVDIIGYVDHKHNRKIEFWYYDEKINMIDYSIQDFNFKKTKNMNELMQHKGNYVVLRTPSIFRFGAFFRFECNHKKIFIMRLIELTRKNLADLIIRTRKVSEMNISI